MMKYFYLRQMHHRTNTHIPRGSSDSERTHSSAQSLGSSRTLSSWPLTPIKTAQGLFAKSKDVTIHNKHCHCIDYRLLYSLRMPPSTLLRALHCSVECLVVRRFQMFPETTGHLPCPRTKERPVIRKRLCHSLAIRIKVVERHRVTPPVWERGAA